MNENGKCMGGGAFPKAMRVSWNTLKTREGNFKYICNNIYIIHPLQTEVKIYVVDYLHYMVCEVMKWMMPEYCK